MTAQPFAAATWAATIALQSGAAFSIADPASTPNWSIEDIAHGLSQVCRFAGQSPVFYSVAQHSWHVSYLVPLQHALAALLDEAAEAFIGDVTAPLKALLPDYRAIEARVEAAILGRWGIALPLHPSIKEADRIMLATEQRDIMQSRALWSGTAGIEPLPYPIRAWPAPDARRMFLKRFVQLIGDAA